ncbi:MAG: hypothetical protein II297_05400, partial [Clostridia bacterium]|nr:hypothetical protein [Clostridia bacterium]
MDVISNTFRPMADLVTRSYIYCKRYEGDSIEKVKPYISDIYVADGACVNEALAKLAAYKPDGLIERDFNEGTGGKKVYVAYKRTTERSKAITDLAVFVGKNPTESKRINVGSVSNVRYDLAANVDLNAGAGGKWLYLYATKNTDVSEPIRFISLESNPASGTKGGIVTSTVQFANANGFTNDDPDLNDGASGSYLYLVVKKPANNTDMLATLFGSGSLIAIFVLAGVGILVGAVVRARVRRKNKQEETAV